VTKKDEKLGEVLRKGEDYLPCHLTPKDITARQEELVKLTQDRVDRETGLDHWKADKKEEQKALEGEISSIAGKLARLAKVIREKEEPRKVKVVYYIKAGEVSSVRTDTGEIIGSRAATPVELQMKLPGEPPTSAADTPQPDDTPF